MLFSKNETRSFSLKWSWKYVPFHGPAKNCQYLVSFGSKNFEDYSERKSGSIGLEYEVGLLDSPFEK